MKKKIGLIGGLLEPDKTYYEAAVRKSRGETGFEISLDNFLSLGEKYQ